MVIEILIGMTLKRIADLNRVISDVRLGDTVSLKLLYRFLDDANAQLNELRGLE